MDQMPLGMEIGFGPVDMMLDDDPATVPKWGTAALSPIFGPCLLWIRHDTTLGTEVALSPGDIVLDGDQGPLL